MTNSVPRVGTSTDRCEGSVFLVTGAAGFIGSHLCDRLVQEGATVWGLDNFDDFYAPSRKRKNLETALAHDSMHLVEGDVRDPVLLDGLMADVDIDAVVHLAARPGVEASRENPGATFDVNVNGTLKLLEAISHHRIPCLVYASSDEVYGAGDFPPYHENMPADRPLSPYAASKRAGEMLCHAYHHLHDLTVHCLRLATVYGPRQRPDVAIQEFAERMASGDPPATENDELNDETYTYVDDIIDGMVLSLKRANRRDGEGAEYQVVNMGRIDVVPVARVLDVLGGAMGRAQDLRERPEKTTETETRIAGAVGERGKELFGFEPRVELEKGLMEFIRWFRETGPVQGDSVSQRSSDRARD